MQEFLEQVLYACSNMIKFNASVFSPPVRIEDPPVYGKLGLSFTDYMGPGVISRYVAKNLYTAIGTIVYTVFVTLKKIVSCSYNYVPHGINV